MSQFPPSYSKIPEVNYTASTLESDLVPRETEQLLERCPPPSVTLQPHDKQVLIQQEDAGTQSPRGIPLTPWHQDCTWNSPVTTRASFPTEQTAQESIVYFATKPCYFESIVVLACLSVCCSLPIGLCAFGVALCAYSQFTGKKYNSAMVLSWVALALRAASVIVSVVATVLFFKLYCIHRIQQPSPGGQGGTDIISAISRAIAIKT